MTIEILTCEHPDHLGDRQWPRERKRGVKPSTCDACKAAAKAVEQIEVEPEANVDAELVALYAAENRLSEFQVRPFVIEGIEPPDNSGGRVDRAGFTIEERKIMDRYASVLPTMPEED